MSNIDWLAEPSRARKRVIFARHAQYSCNLRNVCNSDPTIAYDLTELGQQQAIDLGERLRDEGIGLIISSAFVRARQTAWLVNQALNVPIVVNQLANENRVGSALEGQHVERFLDFIRSAPATTAAPDGEHFLAMKARIVCLLWELQRSSPATILVITHGWPLQAVRVLTGAIGDDAGAMCVDMPGNCATLCGVSTDAIFMAESVPRTAAQSVPRHSSE